MPPSSLQTEVDFLYEKNFLLSSDRLTDIKDDSYRHKIWADIFWRRRFRHTRREDPELKYIFQTNPSSILEIGAGYGRVLRKLLDENDIDFNNVTLKGIEICRHFDTYFQQYRSLHPSLQQVDIIFDNFFTTSAFKEHSFDIILLPMNTLANFSFADIKMLFKTIHKYLSEDGLFFFSNYKILDKEHLNHFTNKKFGYSGDLLVDLGSGLITAEYFDLPSSSTEFGASSVTFICYSSFSREYTLVNRELFRSLTTFILPDPLKQLITTCGFSLDIFDDSSHSFVYGLKKIK